MYAKINNGVVEKYPYTVDDLRQENPQTSFPAAPSTETLAEFGVVNVVVVGHPPADHTKNVTEGIPVYSTERNRWEQVWVVSDASAEEVAQRTEVQAGKVRSQRNVNLKDCDWTQLNDSPVTDTKKFEWVTYRQALRDISAQPGFPWAVDWPVVPQ